MNEWTYNMIQVITITNIITKVLDIDKILRYTTSQLQSNSYVLGRQQGKNSQILIIITCFS